MTAPVGAPDVAAFGDVLDDFASEAETAPMVRLVEIDAALHEVEGKLAMSRSLVTTAMLRAVELRSVTVGGWRFYRRNKTRKVADHPAIRAAIVDRAVYSDDGELLTDPRVIAERTIAIAYDLFLSQSSAPKVSGCKVLARSYDELVDVEVVGSELGREQLRAVGS